MNIINQWGNHKKEDPYFEIPLGGGAKGGDKIFD